MEFPALPFESPASPALEFHFEAVSFDLPQADRLADWLINAAAAEQKRLTEVNIIFCTDERLREINIEYLDHDYYTDVITFPYDDDHVCGDIFISSERVADNAQTAGVSFLAELCRVMVHGVLHLAGYDDQTPAAKAAMSAREDVHLQHCPIF